MKILKGCVSPIDAISGNIYLRIILCVVVASLILLADVKLTEAQQGEWTGNVNIFLGAKALDEDDWSPADEQGEFGIKVDFRPKSWPVNIAIDFLGSSGEGTAYDPYSRLTINLKSNITELNVGIRKIWDNFPHVRPFIGGGLSFMNAEAEGSALGVTVSDSDTATGIWLGGGVYWTLSEHFNLGLELMYSSAKVEIFGVDADAGGGHFGVLAGYHW